MTKDELKKLIYSHTAHSNDFEVIWTAVEAYTSASNGAKPIVSGSLPLVSREELISLLEDKRICKMSNLPADIYYLSRKETADYLIDNFVITKRQ